MLPDEPKERGEDQAGKSPEEGKTLDGRRTVVNVIQQNAVIVTGRKIKGGEAGPDDSTSQRWL